MGDRGVEGSEENSPLAWFGLNATDLSPWPPPAPTCVDAACLRLPASPVSATRWSRPASSGDPRPAGRGAAQIMNMRCVSMPRGAHAPRTRERASPGQGVGGRAPQVSIRCHNLSHFPWLCPSGPGTPSGKGPSPPFPRGHLVHRGPGRGCRGTGHGPSISCCHPPATPLCRLEGPHSHCLPSTLPTPTPHPCPGRPAASLSLAVETLTLSLPRGRPGHRL